MNFYKRLFKRKPVNQGIEDRGIPKTLKLSGEEMDAGGIIEEVCGQLDRTAEFAEQVNPENYARIKFGLYIEDLKTELRAFAKAK